MSKSVAATKVRSNECCASVLAAPLDAADAAELASGFSALADPVRLRVLSILAASPEGEVCVCDFVKPWPRASPPFLTTSRSSARRVSSTVTGGASGSGTRSTGSGWPNCGRPSTANPGTCHLAIPTVLEVPE